MSVAASVDMWSRAVIATFSMALNAAPVGRDSAPDDTAFRRPAVTVDFSACVADMVRR